MNTYTIIRKWGTNQKMISLSQMKILYLKTNKLDELS